MARQSYAALQAKINKEIERLKKQAEALQSKKRIPVIRSIVKSMKEYDITPEEIAAAFGKGAGRPKTGSKAPNRSRGPVAPKYRDSSTGQTWTGRGKAPKWLSQAEAAGHSREQFLINK